MALHDLVALILFLGDQRDLLLQGLYAVLRFIYLVVCFGNFCIYSRHFYIEFTQVLIYLSAFLPDIRELVGLFIPCFLCILKFFFGLFLLLLQIRYILGADLIGFFSLFFLRTLIRWLSPLSFCVGCLGIAYPPQKAGM